jgi:hypothetical protein
VTVQEVGDSFRTVTGLIDALTIDEEDIEHAKGKEVMVIQFWETFNPVSIEAIANSEKIMEKNAGKWSQKVRIMAVSMDESPKDAIAVAKQNGWKFIEQYHVGE